MTEPPSPSRLDIEPLVAGQVDAVLAIETLSQPSPWTRQMFLDELSRPWAHLDVARIGERVVGYMNYWLVDDEVQLHNLAVHPDVRRRGLGNRLLQHLIAFARAHACALITLEVRSGNAAARALYENHGFVAVGVRKSYYARENEDAVVMNLALV